MASNPYFSLAVLFFAALGFGLAPLGLAWLWGRVFSPAKPNAVKNAIYECGLESKGDAWVQFRSVVLPVRDHLSDFRRGGGVSAARLRWRLRGWAWRRAWPCWCLCLLLIEGLAWAWAKGVLTWA